jgi:primase-polymerase (primpol)-like protein
VIPEELRALPQWVTWRAEERNGRATKVPYDPKRPAHRASSTDPETWGTYRQALEVVDAGVGFVFTEHDPYVGVDMDKCVSRSGAIHAGAHEVERSLGGYVEFSPSGTGLHVIVKGRLDRGRHTLKTPWHEELAIYDRGRFFTMLGDGRGTPRAAQAEIDALLARYFPDPVAMAPVARSQPVCGDDATLVDRMLGDGRVAALWAGDTGAHGGDHSAADCALCAHLAYFTGNDPERMDSLFRRSGLMRAKWDQPRGKTTYGRATIERALRG